MMESIKVRRADFYIWHLTRHSKRIWAKIEKWLAGADEMGRASKEISSG